MKERIGMITEIEATGHTEERGEMSRGPAGTTTEDARIMNQAGTIASLRIETTSGGLRMRDVHPRRGGHQWRDDQGVGLEIGNEERGRISKIR
jgi:hypothetical protein